jgi:hypothetical protein
MPERKPETNAQDEKRDWINGRKRLHIRLDPDTGEIIAVLKPFGIWATGAPVDEDE